MADDVGTMLPTAPNGELTSAASRAVVQRVNGRPFQKGQSGNPAGRPKGSRNRISELFALAVRDDFAVHGPAAIASLRERDPAAYLSMVNSMVSRDALVIAEERMDVVDYDGMSDADYVDALDGGDMHAATQARRRAAFELMLSGKASSLRDAMKMLGASM